VTHSSTLPSWGEPPWKIAFTPRRHEWPGHADFAVIGAGFTGLAAASWLKLLAPEKSVVVLEAGKIGAGASGRTGGLFLAETAAGDLPGLGDVIAGVQSIFAKLTAATGVRVAERAELTLPGAWEIARKDGRKASPIQWNDSGTLRVVGDVPGGTIDPGGLLSALAECAERLGVMIFENHPVTNWILPTPTKLGMANGAQITAMKLICAVNAGSLELAGYGEDANARLTLAAITAPISREAVEAIGLGERKPFYTVDFPYLWGRIRKDNSIVWGAGLVSPPRSRDLTEVSIADAEPQKMFATLEKRVHSLHPELHGVQFAHTWGGPILFREGWTPVLDRHRNNPQMIVIGAYAGHGVALSSYFGVWAAEALVTNRELPNWAALNRSR
jgi:glycine/D-amino acid oxidase-like deaminating enzyme